MLGTIHPKHGVRPNINGNQNYATAGLLDPFPRPTLEVDISSSLHEIFNVMIYKDGI